MYGQKPLINYEILRVCFEEGTDMGNAENLLSKMNKQYQSFSKGQKKLATYINDNYDKAAFLTAARLGETVGVSESTVVRFAIHLGYKGYPEFQKALEELVRNKPELHTADGSDLRQGSPVGRSWIRCCIRILIRSS